MRAPKPNHPVKQRSPAAGVGSSVLQVRYECARSCAVNDLTRGFRAAVEAAAQAHFAAREEYEARQGKLNFIALIIPITFTVARGTSPWGFFVRRLCGKGYAQSLFTVSRLFRKCDMIDDTMTDEGPVVMVQQRRHPRNNVAIALKRALFKIV
ncbi:hypothetical protein EVAR_83603_1 [Eumeta japonica]|uniref:Uncharacterized protein n=1 Tax=Eumeta variegata TaxID=151549 RepID=A0A4C1UPS0_EUMVA|nr:hypothetical protein EVAR_83603_1 [Eumeta japonica]